MGILTITWTIFELLDNNRKQLYHQKNFNNWMVILFDFIHHYEYPKMKILSNIKVIIDAIISYHKI